MPFKKLRLIKPLLSAVHSEGYEIPTAIQQKAIPHVLEGRDLLGCAQTGTGKTAAFALPILQRLHLRVTKPKPTRQMRAAKRSKRIRSLILTPTRELAAQIGESFRVYGKHTGLRHTVIFGGVKQVQQTRALHRWVDIVVATPGRLLDLRNQRVLSLSDVEIFVLDEADRMLDMGFIPDIRRVIEQLPSRRQTLMFSATMPGKIRELAKTILHRPVHVTIAAESLAADTVEQSLYFVDPRSKQALLKQLLDDPKITRALVFTRTKYGADKVVRRLVQGDIVAQAIHSNKSQYARLKALASFKNGKTRVLVASDIAARGLDVDDISHVINYDLPNVAETYVHRIGRTGRAGATGQAISFCSDDQRNYLRDIERLLGRAIPVLQHSIKSKPLDVRESQAGKKPKAKVDKKQKSKAGKKQKAQTSKKPKAGAGKKGKLKASKKGKISGG